MEINSKINWKHIPVKWGLKLTIERITNGCKIVQLGLGPVLKDLCKILVKVFVITDILRLKVLIKVR